VCSADVSITQNYLISGSDSAGSLGCFYFDDSPPLVPRAEKLFPHLCEFVTELLSRRKNSGERSVTKAAVDACAPHSSFSTCKSFVVKVMCARPGASARFICPSNQHGNLSTWNSSSSAQAERLKWEFNAKESVMLYAPKHRRRKYVIGLINCPKYAIWIFFCYSRKTRRKLYDSKQLLVTYNYWFCRICYEKRQLSDDVKFRNGIMMLRDTN